MADNDKRPLDELDFQLITLLAAGKTQQQAADGVLMAEYPGGVHERTVRNRIAGNKDAYDRLRLFVAALFRAREDEIRDISKAEYLEKLASLRSKGLLVKERVLNDAINGIGPLELAVKVADGIEDRDFGKAKQVTAYEGDVNVHHRIWGQPQPASLLASQDADMEASRNLLSAVPAVLEGEVIDAH